MIIIMIEQRFASAITTSIQIKPVGRQPVSYITFF